MTKKLKPIQHSPFNQAPHPPPYYGGEQIEIHTLSQEQSGLPEISFDEDIPLLEGFKHEDDKKAKLDRAREFIKRSFLKVDFTKLGPINFDKKSGNENDIVSLGTMGGETKIFKQDGKDLLKSFTDKFKDAFGPKAEDNIAEDVASI